MERARGIKGVTMPSGVTAVNQCQQRQTGDDCCRESEDDALEVLLNEKESGEGEGLASRRTGAEELGGNCGLTNAAKSRAIDR